MLFPLETASSDKMIKGGMSELPRYACMNRLEELLSNQKRQTGIPNLFQEAPFTFTIGALYNCLITLD